jgi:hypothetical protein
MRKSPAVDRLEQKQKYCHKQAKEKAGVECSGPGEWVVPVRFSPADNTQNKEQDERPKKTG